MANETAGQISLSRLSYVIYEHPSLNNFRQFALDFGSVEEKSDLQDTETAYFRGYGFDPVLYVAKQGGSTKKFIGAAFAAHTVQDFNKAIQMPGAKMVEMHNSPGGGRSVELSDPNGSTIVVLWGQKARPVPDHGVSNLIGHPAMNGALDKNRIGEFTRMKHGPALIHKLGHFGYITDNFEATCQWYQENFNFKPTDVLHAPGDSSTEVAVFFHLDLGKTFVDHHCLLIARNEGKGTTVHHSSFEVEDIDTQFMGHQWLRDKGHSLVWGIGRHVHGSQVFDYWYDASRFIIEHYADGDVVNEDSPVTRAEAGNMAVWGPPVPDIWKAKAEQHEKGLPVAVG